MPARTESRATYDVIVVGGGIAGSSVAYSSVRSGLRTALVQRTDPGTATLAGAGIILPVSIRPQPEAWVELIFPAVRYYEELVASLREDGETDLGYDRSSALFVAQTPEEQRAVGELHRRLDARGWVGATGIGDVDDLSEAEARREFPPLREGTAALRLSGGARVDGRRLRRALQQAVARRGGTIIEGDATVVVDADRVTAVRVGDDLHPAGAVVVATGAWTDVLGPHRDLAALLPVAPQRGQILHLDVPGGDTSGWPILDCVDGHYVLTFAPNRVVVGATRESDAGFDHRVTVAGQQELLGVAGRLAPGLASATVVETRIGFRPASADGLPILGALGPAGLFALGGLGASGLTLGPYCGRLLAELATGSAPSTPLDAFQPARFRDSSTDRP